MIASPRLLVGHILSPHTLDRVLLSLAKGQHRGTRTLRDHHKSGLGTYHLLDITWHYPHHSSCTWKLHDILLFAFYVTSAILERFRYCFSTLIMKLFPFFNRRKHIFWSKLDNLEALDITKQKAKELNLKFFGNSSYCESIYSLTC